MTTVEYREPPVALSISRFCGWRFLQAGGQPIPPQMSPTMNPSGKGSVGSTRY